MDSAGDALEARIREEAKSICENYLCPPYTTDFAILFLPIESLYAEVLRRPGLMDKMQRDYRVTLAGPTTLLAMLNSLQMGFRTLALEQQASEVWKVLGAVKTEFERYGEWVARIKRAGAEGRRHGRQGRHPRPSRCAARSRWWRRCRAQAQALPPPADRRRRRRPHERARARALARLIAGHVFLHACMAACAWPRRCWRCARATARPPSACCWRCYALTQVFLRCRPAATPTGMA